MRHTQGIQLGLAEKFDRRLFLQGAGAAAVLAILPSTAKGAFGTINTVVGGAFRGEGQLATTAAIATPWGTAVDGNGRVYISDNYYHRIYRVDPATGILNTVAGNGIPGSAGDGGPAASANLNFPYGIGADAAGDLAIADGSNNKIRWVDGSSGVISTVAGTLNKGYNGDNRPGTKAALNSPRGAAIDPQGNVVIADSFNNRVRYVNRGLSAITLFPNSTSPIVVQPGYIVTVAGTGAAAFSGDGGIATAAKLNLPMGVQADTAGNIYIADFYNQRVRMINALTGVISTVAGNGTKGNTGDGGPAVRARIYCPCSLAFDTAGNLYIGQEQTSLVRMVNLSTGVIATVAGKGGFGETGDGGPALNAGLSSPTGIALDSSNNLYIAEYNNARTRWVNGATAIINTFAGCTNFGNGSPAVQASLNDPCGFCFDAAGNLLLADESNQMVRKVTPSGMIQAVAGTGLAGFSKDGIPALKAALNVPSDVQVDAAGNIYICDRGTGRIRKVDSAKGLISTVAGKGGISLSSGDGGPAIQAGIDDPRAITIDANGNLYIAEIGSFRVRFVNLGANPVTLYPGSPNALTVGAGIIITVAGTGLSGTTGDGGPAVLAEVNSPRGVTTDLQGNLYITEGGRDPQNPPGPGVVPDCVIRKIDAATGIISTVAGTLTVGYNGDGIPATQANLNGPRNVVLDRNGNMYIADSLNNRIRCVDATTGLISTVIGGSTQGFGGDGGPASAAIICTPRYVNLDSAGNLYFTDSGNSRIRMITLV
jgi:sugar lactone lactonase YvrE